MTYKGNNFSFNKISLATCNCGGGCFFISRWGNTAPLKRMKEEGKNERRMEERQEAEG